MTTSSGDSARPGEELDDDVDHLLGLAHVALETDLPRCAALLDRAEAQVTSVRDLRRGARLGELRGRLALASGDLPFAGAALRHARLNWLAAGMRLEALRAALGSTAVQLAQGEVEDAARALERIRESLGVMDGGVERELTALHATAHRQVADARAAQGDISAALRHFDVAENMFHSLGDVAGVGKVDLGRGLAQLDSGMSHRALAEISRGRSELLRAGHTVAASVALIHIAEALSATGQVARSLELLDRVRQELPANRLSRALHGLSRAHALLRAGLPAEAHAEAGAAGEAFSELGIVERAARAALAAGNGSMQLGQLDAARRELATADRLFADCGSRLMRARTWIGRARLALAVGDNGEAGRFCQDVLTAEVEELAPYLSVEARLIMARVESEATAEDLLDTTASLVHEIGVPELRAEVSLGRGRHLRRWGDPQAAVQELRLTLDVGRAWNLWSTDGAGGGPTHSAMTEATDELIEVLLDRNDYGSRVEAWQRASVAKQESLVPFAERAHGWEPHLARGARQERMEELAVGNPAKHSAPRPPRRSGDLPSVPVACTVDYYTSGDRVTAFVLHEGHVEVRRLGNVGGRARRLMKAWHQECLLISASRERFAHAQSSQTLDALFSLLVAPVAPLLAGLRDEIDVGSHRYLNAVPFDALFDRVHVDAAEPAFREIEAAGFAAASTRPLGALVLAVPDDNAPFIHDEAEMIVRTLPGAEVLSGSQATRRRLAELAREAEVIHFACHGVFRRANPLMSALRMGDGWLRARDVLAGEVPVQGRLVVLSACGTGMTADYLSEPLGLAWAFLTAGARGVVATLWSVDDAITMQLMTHFYGLLAEGRHPSVALRAARRAVAQVHPHPYYWAGFRYLGGTADQPAAAAFASRPCAVARGDEAV